LKKTLVLLAIFALGGLAGCKAATITEIEADAHALGTLAAGAAATVVSFSETNPDAITELGVVAQKLAAAAGVSAEDQAILTQEITPANAKKVAVQVGQVGTKIANATKGTSSP
jgi:hypothetical protein